MEKVRKNKYSVNNLFFKNIDCREVMWVLGWLYSDGNLYSKRLQLRLHKKDEDIIDKIIELLEFKGFKYNLEKVNQKSIQIYNNEISEDFNLYF